MGLRELEQKAGAGALISHSKVLELCDFARAADRITAPIEWLTVPTCGRRDGLLRTIQSYAANSLAFGRRPAIFIAEQCQSGEDNRAMLSAFAAESNTRVFYAGDEEKLSFARHLTQGGSIPPEVVQFALFGCANSGANMGANRNAILLQTLGSRLLSVDDDTVCEPASVPGSGQNVHFGCEADPTDVWFFGDRCSARGFVERREVDLLQAHERLLGKGLHDLVAGSGSDEPVSIHSPCLHILGHLCSGGGQILSTYNGLVGDAGIHSSFPLLVHPRRPTKERLTSSEDAYRQNSQSREIVRQALVPTVGHGPGAAGVAAFLGLDNRQLLPPFLPSFRGEDGIFAEMLARCREGACTGHVPLTLLHDRPAGRVYGDVATLRMSHLIAGGLHSCSMSVAERSCSDRMSYIGKHLIFLASLAEEEFRQWVRTTICRRASSIAKAAHLALMREYSEPEYWAEDLSQTTDRLLAVALDPTCTVPEELRPGGGTGGLGAAREIIRLFGELLRWWPAIVERTRELAEKGMQIGQCLGP